MKKLSYEGMCKVEDALLSNRDEVTQVFIDGEDRSVVNGHVLFKPADFTEAEIARRNLLAIAVVEEGVSVCMRCRADGRRLHTPCRATLGVSYS